MLTPSVSPPKNRGRSRTRAAEGVIATIVLFFFLAAQLSAQPGSPPSENLGEASGEVRAEASFPPPSGEPEGAFFQWGVQAGGLNEDAVNDIVCLGNDIYATGRFSDTIVSGSSKAGSAGMTDIYLARLDKNGKTDWVKSLGGSGADQATRLAAGEKCIYMAGELAGPVSSSKQEYPGNGKALFIASWNTSGKINWLSRFDYTGNLTLDVLEVAPDGGLLAGGMLSGLLKAGDETLDSKPGRRAYILSVSPEGQLVKAQLTKGGGDHRLVSATYGKDGVSYLLFHVRGWMAYGNDATLFSTSEDFTGLVLMKGSPDGDRWAKYFKGSNYIQGVKLVAGQDNGVSACINYTQTLTTADTTLTTHALQDVAVFSYSAEGKLNWLKQLQSPVVCYAMDALNTRDGKLLVTGYFRESYAFGEEVLQANLPGGLENMFLAQLDKDGKLSWHDEPGEEASGFGRAIALNREGDILIAGGFEGDISLDGKELKSSGKEDVLVAKYFNCGQLEVEITSAEPLCQDGYRELEATPGSFESYIWNDSVWSEELVVSAPGTYTLEAFDGKGCSATDTVQVVWADVPDPGLVPETFLAPGQQTQLAANEGFFSYRWHDGLTGPVRNVEYDDQADSSVFILHAETPEGCLAADTAVVHFVKDEFKLAGARSSSHQVYPNPVSGFLWWSVNIETPTEIGVALYDERGSVVYRETIDHYIPYSHHKIDMGAMPGGSYLLSLAMGEVVMNEKIIKK